MIRWLFYIFLLCAPQLIIAQCASEGWSQSYGADGMEMAYSLDRFSNGDLLLGGESDSEGAGSMDWLFLRVDSDGNVVWSNVVGTSQLDSGKDVVVKILGDDSFLFAGYTHSNVNAPRKTVIGLFDSDGSEIWMRELTSNAPSETPRNIFVSEEGRIYIMGTSNSYGMGSSDGMIFEIDLFGNILWSTTYGQTNNDHFLSAGEKSNGNIVIAGNSQSWDNITHHAWITQMTPDGTFVSEFIFHDDAQEIFSSLIIDDDDNMYLTGWSKSFGNGSKDMFLLKLNPQFEIEWQKNFSGNGDDSPSYMHLHEDQLIISTLSASYGSTSANLLLFCADLDGNVQWANTYFDDFTSTPGFFADNIVSSGEHLFAAGGIDENGGDIFLLKINECGETGCETAQVLVEQPGEFISEATFYSDQNMGPLDDFSAQMAMLSVEATPVCQPLCTINAAFEISGACTGEQIEVAESSSWEGTDDVIFEWNFGNGEFSEEQNPTMSYDESGDYFVTLVVTDAGGQCIDSLTQEISIEEAPIINPLTNLELCGEETVDVVATCDNSDCYLHWPGITGGAAITVSESGEYVAVASNNCGSDTTAFSASYTENPWSGQQVLYDLCETDSVVVAIPAAYEVMISDEIINELVITNPGEYWLSAEQNGCSFNLMIEVLDAPPVALWTYSPEDCYPSLDISSLYGCDGCDSLEVVSTQLIGTDQTMYLIEASQGCGSRTDSLIVDHMCDDCEVYVPNAFTPNDDGINEVFKPEINCEPWDYEFVVYNRWGELVWESHDVSDTWSGSGEKGSHYVVNDVYSWHMRIIFLKGQIEAYERSGYITVIR
jgi:gliding motility-associated-like protein